MVCLVDSFDKHVQKTDAFRAGLYSSEHDIAEQTRLHIEGLLILLRAIRRTHTSYFCVFESERADRHRPMKMIILKVAK